MEGNKIQWLFAEYNLILSWRSGDISTACESYLEATCSYKMQRAFTELASYHTYMAEHSVCDCRLCAQQCCYPLCENSRFLAEGIPDVPVGWSGATKLTASSDLAFSALFSLRFREGLFQQVQCKFRLKVLLLWLHSQSGEPLTLWTRYDYRFI